MMHEVFLVMETGEVNIKEHNDFTFLNNDSVLISPSEFPINLYIDGTAKEAGTVVETLARILSLKLRGFFIRPMITEKTKNTHITFHGMLFYVNNFVNDLANKQYSLIQMENITYQVLMAFGPKHIVTSAILPHIGVIDISEDRLYEKITIGCSKPLKQETQWIFWSHA